MIHQLDYQKLTLNGEPIRVVDVIALMTKLENKSNDPKIRKQMKKLLDYWCSEDMS